MRMIKLTMCDFRGFYDRHEIEFAADDKERVTVFYGLNGAGKSNLLNAIHWCITGKFTLGLKQPQLIVNKEASKEGRRKCFVEMLFREDGQAENKHYRVRRSTTNERQTEFHVYEVEGGNDRIIDRGESLMQMLLPPGLASWFFFDTEAFGALTLSGSDEFKRGLRKTLGFELIDKIVHDLEQVQAKLRREIASQSNDEQLKNLQVQMDHLDHILPGQEASLAQTQEEIRRVTVARTQVREQLSSFSQAAPLEQQRVKAEERRKTLMRNHEIVAVKSAFLIGRAAPSLMLNELTSRLEGKLEDHEVRGRLPAPYSDQLVKDILLEELCICGRAVTEGSHEALKITELLQFASTGILNQRISGLRYLIRDIEREHREYPVNIVDLRNQISTFDKDIAKCEEEIEEVEKKLRGIDIEEIKNLELNRQDLDREFASLHKQEGATAAIIEQNKRKYKELQRIHEAAAIRLKVSATIKKEQDKVVRLTKFIKDSLVVQEKRALEILSIELNSVLFQYLRSHYSAKIDVKNYAIKLIDADGSDVPESTGEGQVLKYAFIATVVALAAKKTQEKIEWLTEPTIAPLVLDAPFSALDKDNQGSVTTNLAKQATQLVLMMSDGVNVEKVSAALDGVVGKRYLIVSHEFGPKGNKPETKMTFDGKAYLLNYYDAVRSESTIQEVKE